MSALDHEAVRTSIPRVAPAPKASAHGRRERSTDGFERARERWWPQHEEASQPVTVSLELHSSITVALVAMAVVAGLGTFAALTVNPVLGLVALVVVLAAAEFQFLHRRQRLTFSAAALTRRAGRRRRSVDLNRLAKVQRRTNSGAPVPAGSPGQRTDGQHLYLSDEGHGRLAIPLHPTFERSDAWASLILQAIERRQLTVSPQVRDLLLDLAAR